MGGVTGADGTRPGRARTIVSVVAGAVCLMVAAFLLAVVQPRSEAEVTDFRAARACPAGERGEDCLRSGQATVEDKRAERRKKSTRYYLTLREGSAPEADVRLDDDDPVYGSVGPGDRVTVVRWRGEIRYVATAAGARQRTHAHPEINSSVAGAVGLGLLPFGSGLLALAWATPRWAARTRVRHPWQAGLLGAWMVLAAPVWFLAGIMVPEVFGSRWTAAAVGALASVPVVALLLPLVLRYRDRPEGIKVKPKFLRGTGTKTFPGIVLGDVPYAAVDAPYSGNVRRLVVGRGVLEATCAPPVGAETRQELPGDLTVQRVRPPYRDDPRQVADAYDVVECRDGAGRQVLIAAARKHVPFIVGVLAPDAVRR
ncbi:hypothetical protein [Streptomyces sp. NBC_01304]|uniref:hypothetical protein n=1 Tax=Streptomyces sp. NBC_01304 TaxID=2903818 RepID=UPI002E0D3FD0|nr:hypothetical protein OG430_20520 [Streptomyces sp. NBC_01304]